MKGEGGTGRRRYRGKVTAEERETVGERESDRERDEDRKRDNNQQTFSRKSA